MLSCNAHSVQFAATLCSTFVCTTTCVYASHCMRIAFCNMLIVQYCGAMRILCSLLFSRWNDRPCVQPPPPCHKRVPSVFHLLIMPSFDISSLCHIHRNGSNTRAFNNCYHDQPLFLDFHCGATHFNHFETLKRCQVHFHKSFNNFTNCTHWRIRGVRLLCNPPNFFRVSNSTTIPNTAHLDLFQN